MVFVLLIRTHFERWTHQTDPNTKILDILGSLIGCVKNDTFHTVSFIICVSEGWGELSCPGLYLHLFLQHPWRSRFPWIKCMIISDFTCDSLFYVWSYMDFFLSSFLCSSLSSILPSCLPRESQALVVRKVRKANKVKRWVQILKK